MVWWNIARKTKTFFAWQGARGRQWNIGRLLYCLRTSSIYSLCTPKEMFCNTYLACCNDEIDYQECTSLPCKFTQRHSFTWDESFYCIKCKALTLQQQKQHKRWKLQEQRTLKLPTLSLAAKHTLKHFRRCSNWWLSRRLWWSRSKQGTFRAPRWAPGPKCAWSGPWTCPCCL